MAFQAAQTGHPVMLTFHASDIVSMIQRFTGDPINVPETFMSNCDIALFQNRVKRGNDTLRRVTSVQEIEGYSKEMGGVVTREAFYWDPVDDEIVFQGLNNSFVLEEQIASRLGSRTRETSTTTSSSARTSSPCASPSIRGNRRQRLHFGFQRVGVEGIPFNMARPD